MSAAGNVPSVAKWHPTKRRWIDGAGNAIEGPAPLAQLGVGGQYVNPKDGRTYTIQSVQQMPDSAGRPWTAVRAVATGGGTA